ncbi:MAG: FecR domain-containing protein [Asticcacaulis sp.]
MATDPLLDEAAALLLRRQAEGDDPAFEAELAQWIATSAAHAEAWGLASAFWGQMAEIGADHPVFNAERSPSNVHRLSQLSRRRRTAGWAVGLMAACLVGAIAWPNIRLMLMSDYRTGAGETQAIRLEDGSNVYLDARSAIKVAEGGRHVTLVSGRAFFDVVHDDAAPFTVLADEMRVVDVGTQFDVSLGDEVIGVALAEGIVDVTYPEGTKRMAQAGQSLSYDRNRQQARLETGVVENVATWRQGRLLIEDASVAEVVEQIRPYYKGMIVVTNDRLAKKRVTGVFEVRDPVKALRTLTDPHAGRVKQISPWLVFVS